MSIAAAAMRSTSSRISSQNHPGRLDVGSHLPWHVLKAGNFMGELLDEEV
jgi:hypothetical protein